MAERIYTQQELQAFYQVGPELNALGLIMVPEDSPEAVHNIERIGAFFDLNAHVPVTVEWIKAAVEQMRDQMRWKTQAQIAFDKLGLTQQESDTLFSVIARRDLDPNYALENGTAIAEWIKASGRGIGPQSIDLAIGNIPNSPAGAFKLHWKRRLQDSEKAELARREQNRKDLEENRKTRTEQASIEVHPELRLSEKAKAHRDMMNRQPQKIEITTSAPEYSYWKSRCESAIASIPNAPDRAEAQQLLDAKKGGSYGSAYTFITTFASRRAHERANAASLARMGR